MNILSFLRPQPDRSETAELRDRLIQAETKVILLQDLVEHPRVRREPRKDKQSVRDKKDEVTAKLSRLFPSIRLPLREKA